MATKSERDALLDQLAVATEEWAAYQRDKITKELALLRSLQRGHRGSDRTGKRVSERTQQLVVAALDDFLTGSTSR